MWTTGATHMIARVTGSTLFANSNVASLFGFDHRSFSTANDQESSLSDKNDDKSNIVKKMRDLRGLTPYAHYVKDQYNEISKQNPNLKMIELSKKLAEHWRGLTDEEKKTYFKKAEIEKEIYEKEKVRLSPKDLQKLDMDEKTRRIENRIKKSIHDLPAKRPRTAFGHFIATLDRGEATLQEFMQGASKRWARLSQQEKQKFVELHQEEKKKYNQELVEWALKNKLTAEEKVQKSPPPTSVKKKQPNEISSSHQKKVKTRSSTSPKPAVSASKSRRTNSSEANDDDNKSSTKANPSKT